MWKSGRIRRVRTKSCIAKAGVARPHREDPVDQHPPEAWLISDGKLARGLALALRQMRRRKHAKGQESQSEKQMKDVVSLVQQHRTKMPCPVGGWIPQQESKRRERQVEDPRRETEAFGCGCAQKADAYRQSAPRQMHQVVVFVHVTAANDDEHDHQHKYRAEESAGHLRGIGGSPCATKVMHRCRD